MGTQTGIRDHGRRHSTFTLGVEKTREHGGTDCAELWHITLLSLGFFLKSMSSFKWDLIVQFTQNNGQIKNSHLQ